MSKIKTFDEAKALAAAAEIFRIKGYNSASVAELMAATGMNRSSFYGSFIDKYNLYLLSQKFSKNPQYKVFNDKIIRRGFQKVETLLKSVINYLISGKDAGFPLSADASYEMIRECCSTSRIVCHSKEEVEEMFVNWLNEDRDKITIDFPVSSKVYGQFLFNSICGLRVMSQCGASKHEMSYVARVALDSLKQGKIGKM